MREFVLNDVSVAAGLHYSKNRMRILEIVSTIWEYSRRNQAIPASLFEELASRKADRRRNIKGQKKGYSQRGRR